MLAESEIGCEDQRALQVKELQQQVSDQLQESDRNGSTQGREAVLQHRVHQLESMLRHARDIHGVSMPLLDSDEGLLSDPPQLPTAGTLVALGYAAVAVGVHKPVYAVAAKRRNRAGFAWTTMHVGN